MMDVAGGCLVVMNKVTPIWRQDICNHHDDEADQRSYG